MEKGGAVAAPHVSCRSVEVHEVDSLPGRTLWTGRRGLGLDHAWAAFYQRLKPS